VAQPILGTTKRDQGRDCGSNSSTRRAIMLKPVLAGFECCRRSMSRRPELLRGAFGAAIRSRNCRGGCKDARVDSRRRNVLILTKMLGSIRLTNRRS